MLDSTALIRELVAAPGPPGQEETIRKVVEAHVAALGYESRVDAKGNLLVQLSAPSRPLSVRSSLYAAQEEERRVVVTAHLDEIALMVKNVEMDGTLSVVALGGLYPWKWGEQPVEILVPGEPIPGIVSFGCIHTNAPESVAQQGRTGPLGWEQAFVFTGLLPEELEEHGVRPGVRIALARDRRTVREIGPFLVSYFLDDRADLAAWLLALEALKGQELGANVVFAATVSEEVGGEGALYLMHRYPPDVCIALEIGPSVPESPFALDSQPTVWVNDSYSAIAGPDLERVANLCRELGQTPHWQALSRGGSDASCAAARGLCARPLTFGLPLENSHGLEIMHRDAPKELARLLVACLRTF